MILLLRGQKSLAGKFDLRCNRIAAYGGCNGNGLGQCAEVQWCKYPGFIHPRNSFREIPPQI